MENPRSQSTTARGATPCNACQPLQFLDPRLIYRALGVVVLSLLALRLGVALLKGNPLVVEGLLQVGDFLLGLIKAELEETGTIIRSSNGARTTGGAVERMEGGTSRERRRRWAHGLERRSAKLADLMREGER
jgi:hypothetical protein